MYKLILLFFATFLLNIPARSQTQEELIQEIERLVDNTNFRKKRKRKKTLKNLRAIAYNKREIKEDMAVVNTRIGMALSNKGMYGKAREFYEHSWEIRKEVGEIYKQKWPLRKLVENGIIEGDIEYAMKYSLERIELMDEKREELLSDWEREKGYTSEKAFLEDLLYFIRAIYDYDHWGSKLVGPTAMELKHRLLLYCMEEYPISQEVLMKVAIPFYIHVIRLQLYTNENLETAEMWADRAVDLINANYLNKDFSEDVLSIAYCFTGKGYDHKRKGLKQGFAESGIAIAQRYVDMKYRMEAYKETLYGIRYIAKQYGELGKYDIAFQYLADAIKICNKHQLEDEVVKSIGGLHVMLKGIRKSGNKAAWEKAKKWKEAYDSKGLSSEDIQRINRIIADYPVG